MHITLKCKGVFIVICCFQVPSAWDGPIAFAAHRAFSHQSEFGLNIFSEESSVTT